MYLKGHKTKQKILCYKSGVCQVDKFFWKGTKAEVAEYANLQGTKVIARNLEALAFISTPTLVQVPITVHLTSCIVHCVLAGRQHPFILEQILFVSKLLDKEDLGICGIVLQKFFIIILKTMRYIQQQAIQSRVQLRSFIFQK